MVERPDLSGLPADVVNYIQYLETRLAERGSRKGKSETADQEFLSPEELPTPINIVTISRNGLIKRTPRHLYNRQRRGGMGVFDIELPEQDFPAFLTAADEAHRLLLITNLARSFHFPLNRLTACEVRDKGQPWNERIELLEGEYLAAVLPNPTQGYLALLSKNGYVRRLRHHLFGDYMKAGTSLLDLKESGELVAACSAHGDNDLFILTRSGIGIRFAEKSVPPQGCRGIRLQEGDMPVAICGVKENSGVFLIGADGQGTIRLMSGFAPNKAPGGGGKIVLKTDHLVGAVTVSETEDLFIISRLGKIIRFTAVEVPPKEGVVQGVICMSLRSDECTAVTAGS